MDDSSDALPMHARGVTRPMAERAMREGMHEKGDPERDERGEETSGDSGQDHGDGGHEHGGGHDVAKMLRMHHKQTLWVYWTLVVLGVWLLVAPFTFGYLDQANWVHPSGGRGVWFSETETHDALRAWLTTGSDLVCGLGLLIFGWRSLTPDRPKSLWACCFIGMWLTAAPVLFWSPTVGAYVNDTVVGILAMALSILIPGMPNMIAYMQHGPPQPPGWSYNPSSWIQRWILIVTGLAGLLVSRYLAAYQLGFIDRIWDPFFGFEAGTQQVLDSGMSHMWPISDAGMGALSYTFEFLMGFMGSPARWRTMPWMVAFFGVLVVPLGLTHILLVISQPLVVHHWCFFCIVAAAVMLPMIPLEVDEVVAMIQHLIAARRRGDRGGSLWAIFWKGGKAEGCTMDERSPELLEMPQSAWSQFRASIWGMSFPWTLIGASVVGVVGMFCPYWFGIAIETRAADVAHLGGALLVTISVISMGEVVRMGRWLSVPLGIAVAVLPWFLESATTSYAIACTVVGLLAAVLSIPRGQIRERYGAWNAYIV